MMEVTPDEMLCVCIARQVRDGDLWAQGINTPLVMAGLILARLTHAPNVRFASAIGQGITGEWAPLSVTRNEELWLGKSLMHVGFAQATAEVLPRLQPKEFFRPAQVDTLGNTNNIAIGRNWQRPRLRLPGAGGIPDVTTQYAHVYLYVPRHAPVVFRDRVDFISGLGHVPGRPHGSGPRYLVSNLGQFDWHAGRMRLISVHPGVNREEIIRKTGFHLEYADDLQTTQPPTDEELRLLREIIDPFNVRKLETLAGTARRMLLREILSAEGAL